MAGEVGVEDPMQSLREKVYSTYEQFVREPTNDTKREHFDALDEMVGGRVVTPRRRPDPPAPVIEPTVFAFRNATEETRLAREAAKKKSEEIRLRINDGAP
jgi:hypothetical protein